MQAIDQLYDQFSPNFNVLEWKTTIISFLLDSELKFSAEFSRAIPNESLQWHIAPAVTYGPWVMDHDLCQFPNK